MKFSLFILPLGFVGTDAGGFPKSKIEAIREKRKISAEFMAAMHSNPKVGTATKRGRRLDIAERKRQLREKLIKNARLLYNYESEGQDYGGSGGDYQNGGQYGYNNVQYDGGQYQSGKWNGNGVNGKYLNNNGGGDVNGWGSNWISEYAIDFDMTSKAFKYSGCAAMKTFDSSNGNENPFKTQTYVTFRLCPADSCNKYSLVGCSKNYGEYAIEMELYLESILEYYETRFEQYCEYCLTCDADVQIEAEEMLQECYFEKTLEQNEEYQNQQYQDGGNYNGNNYDSAYNNGNGLQSGYYSNAGGRKLDQGYTKEMYDGKGYWVNGNFVEGFWKDGVFYQYDDEVMETIRQCKKNQQQGNYQNYDCESLNECDEENEEYYPPCDTDNCGDYYNYCSELNGNVRDQSFDVTQYLQCAPYTTTQGKTFYIGPHCADNQYSISLGVFSDEYCTTYIGKSVSLSQVIGYNVDASNIFQIPEECLSCDGKSDADEYIEQKQDQEYAGNGMYDGYTYSDKESAYYQVYVSAPDTDEDGVVAMCSTLYQSGAQCNRNLKSYRTYSQLMTKYELDVENRYCTFIDNIIYGSFDTNGDIVDLKSWRTKENYKELKMPVDQAIGLVTSLFLCFILSAYVLFMHRQIKRRKRGSTSPWVPSKNVNLEGYQIKQTGSTALV